jgi:hypothetical protein
VGKLASTADVNDAVAGALVYRGRRPVAGGGLGCGVEDSGRHTW